ncbi:DUF6398 domain-containing protein [Ammoniphilus sp. YIM 78166]|uniref:DUF6398 domain-containing protein n=1 Tax=Ammoniphilus sp. YIM 78166 TaxID=1644106 RepID=UPI001F0DE793|nr:DUF6398 domain-containing protein [Ammoniphilus sp. YIM 78166]
MQAFCREHLDEECEHLAVKLVEKLSRKRNVPFQTGKLEVWAAGVIHALGTINFMFEKNAQPSISVHDITGFFGTVQNTTSQESKNIRDMLKLDYYDENFSTQRIQEANPFKGRPSLKGFSIPKHLFKP